MDFTAHRQRQGTGLSNIIGPNSGVATAERFASREHNAKLQAERDAKAAEAAKAAYSKKLHKDLSEAKFDGSLNYQSKLNKLANEQYYKPLADYYAESGGSMDISDPKLQGILKTKRRLEQMASDSVEYSTKMDAVIKKVGEKPEDYTSDYLEKLKKNQEKGLEERFESGDWDIPEPVYRNPNALDISSGLLKDFEVLEPSSAQVINMKLKEDRAANGGIPGSYEDQSNQLFQMLSPTEMVDLIERAHGNGVNKLAQFEYERVKKARAPKLTDDGRVAFYGDLEDIASAIQGEKATSIEREDGVTVSSNSFSIDEEKLDARVNDLLLMEGKARIEKDILQGKYDGKGDYKDKFQRAKAYYKNLVKNMVKPGDSEYKVDRNFTVAKEKEQKEAIDVFRSEVNSGDRNKILGAAGSFIGLEVGGAIVSDVLYAENTISESGRNTLKLEFKKKPGRDAVSFGGLDISTIYEEDDKYYLDIDLESAKGIEAAVTFFTKIRKKDQPVKASEKDYLMEGI